MSTRFGSVTRRDPARELQPHLLERLRAPRRTRKNGRAWRAARRLLAAALFVVAGVIATWPSPPEPGVTVLTVAADLPAGHLLTAADIHESVVLRPPDGALPTGTPVAGRALAGAIRRGEIVTDVRLVPTSGPDPGPGRRALTVRPVDPTSVDLISPGMQVSVVGIDPVGAATVLTADGIVLAVPVVDAVAGQLRPVLLGVPRADADRVSAATLTGDVALQFS